MFICRTALGVTAPAYPREPPPAPRAVSPAFWKPIVQPSACAAIRLVKVKLRVNGPVDIGVLNQALPVPPAEVYICTTPGAGNDAVPFNAQFVVLKLVPLSVCVGPTARVPPARVTVPVPIDPGTADNLPALTVVPPE